MMQTLMVLALATSFVASDEALDAPPDRFDVVLDVDGGAVGNAVIASRAGGFRCVGYSERRDGKGKIVFAALADDGTVDWVREIDAFAGAHESAGWDVRESTAGDFLIAGFANEVGHEDDAVLLCVDAAGAVKWSRRFGGAGSERVWAMELLPEGGCVLAGETTSAPAAGRDAFVVRVDDSGAEVWTRVFGGAGTDRVFGVAVVEESSGAATRLDGIVVAGLTREDDQAPLDALVARIAPTGEVMWQKTLGGAADDLAHSILGCADGSLLVTGYGQTFVPTEAIAAHDPNDFLLARLGRDGSLLAANRLRNSADATADDRAMASVELRGGGFATIGYTRGATFAEARIVATDQALAPVHERVLPYAGEDRGVAVVEAANGDLVVTGSFGRAPTTHSRFRVVRLVMPHRDSRGDAARSSRK